MILNFSDKKVTAKQKAQEIIANKLHAVWYTDAWEEDGMTENDKKLIREQFYKIIPRLEKSLGTERV